MANPVNPAGDPARAPATMSEEAAARMAVRQAERERRAAETLRANLQRRKTQSRERSAASPPAVDASVPDHQNEPSD